MKDDLNSVFVGLKLIIRNKQCWLFAVMASIYDCIYQIHFSNTILHILVLFGSIFVLAFLMNCWYLALNDLFSGQAIMVRNSFKIAFQKTGRVILVMFIELSILIPFVCVYSMLMYPSNISSNKTVVTIGQIILTLVIPFYIFSTLEVLFKNGPIKKVIKTAFALWSRNLVKLVLFAILIWLFHWLIGFLFFGTGLLAAHGFQSPALQTLNWVSPFSTKITPAVDVIFNFLISMIYIIMCVPVFMILYKKYADKADAEKQVVEMI